MNCALLFLLLIAPALPAAAQGLSAEDIRAQVDARVAALDPFRKLLSDPDETRAVAAMEIMMEAQDPALRRMALEYGLYSPSRVVRRTALEAFFAARPTLSLRMTMAKNASAVNFAADMRDYAGSVGDSGKGFFQVTLGPFDPAQGCFLKADSSACVLRNSDAGVAIELWGRWWDFGLDEDGVLAGSGNSSRGIGMSATIPVAF